MNVTDIQNTINVSIPAVLQNYNGNLDICGVRNGFATETWKNKSPQKYTGLYTNDCLHKYGTYEWNYDKEKYIYEGKIYANNLDGYGLLSYPDGSSYEGLFKYNQRYGPGVLTYSNGCQDVGLWNGLNLVRLSCRVNRSTVPNLAHSVAGKVYLTQYKKLVSVLPRTISTAEKILQELNASEKVQNERHLLYNSFIRNPNSKFFDVDKFNTEYFEDEPQTVDVIVSYEDGSPKLKKKVVSDLLAWNNEEQAISIMKHAFFHRNYETNLSFSVNDILVGKRDEFSCTGPVEDNCIQFLMSCSEGDHRKVTQLITKHDLNPDVCDLAGNSGIHYAIINNHFGVIKTLVNYGANLDILNDEGLTSLLMCLLHYISVQEKVTDWEQAFLNSVPSEQPHSQWRPYISKSAHLDQTQPFILDLRCVTEKPDVLGTSKGTSRGKSKLLASKSRQTKQPKSKSRLDLLSAMRLEIEAEEARELHREKKMKDISQTLSILLNCGVDPNYGKVPLPPLILALFTKNFNFVEDLIKHGADCNITTSCQDGSLTPLHVIASLQPSETLLSMADILLNNNAEPNSRANTDHWLEEKQIISPEDQCIDEGKTPLHLLSMRYDFLYDVADYLGSLFNIMVENGADPNLFYLGHTCLSLAIIRGNLSLLTRILESHIADPNQFLGCDMGVPLTVLILKRYKQLLPVPTCRNIYEILTNFNACPFNPLPDFVGNAIEFCEHENREDGSAKKSRVKKKDSHTQVITFLYDNARQMLDRHIQGFVVKCLYLYKIEDGRSDIIFDYMVKFVNVEDTMRILQILLNEKVIHLNLLRFKALIDYVTSKTVKRTGSKKRSARSKSGSREGISERIKNFQREPQIQYKINVPKPETDPGIEKYVVCYNCFKKEDQLLVLCPRCELVYFCSEQCNAISLKSNTKHKCKGNFYKSELKKMISRRMRGESFSTKMNTFKKLREGRDSVDDIFERRYGAGSTMGIKIASLIAIKKKSPKKSRERKEGSRKKRGKKKDKGTASERSSDSSMSSKSSKKSKKKKKDGKKKKKKKGSKGRKSSDESSGESSDSSSDDSSRSRKGKSKDKKKKGKDRGRSKTRKDKSKKKKKGKSKDSDESSSSSSTSSERSKSRGKSKGKGKDKDKKGTKTKTKAKSKTKLTKDLKFKAKSKAKSKQELKEKGKKKLKIKEPTEKLEDKGKKLADKRTKSKSPEKESKKGKDEEKTTASKSKMPGDTQETKSDVRKDTISVKSHPEERPTLADKHKDILMDSNLFKILTLHKSFLPCVLLIDGQLYYKFTDKLKNENTKPQRGNKCSDESSSSSSTSSERSKSRGKSKGKGKDKDKKGTKTKTKAKSKTKLTKDLKFKAKSKAKSKQELKEKGKKKLKIKEPTETLEDKGKKLADKRTKSKSPEKESKEGKDEEKTT